MSFVLAFSDYKGHSYHRRLLQSAIDFANREKRYHLLSIFQLGCATEELTHTQLSLPGTEQFGSFQMVCMMDAVSMVNSYRKHPL